MSARTRTQALAYLRERFEHGPDVGTGWCLREVRKAYGIAALHPDASTAWRKAARKHPTTDLASIPPGVPVFWTGGAGGFGHVAVKAGGRGHDVWTTDFVRRGRFDRVDGRKIGPTWGLKLEGWAEDLNGVRVYTPPRPRPRPSKPNHVTAARGYLEAARKGLEQAADELEATSPRRLTARAAAEKADDLAAHVARLLAWLPPT